MASIADLEGGMNAARQKLSEYTQTSPAVLKEEIDKAWHPLISGAANEVSKMKQDFLPRYFTGMMNEGYGMGTSEADLSPTQKLSQMGSTLGQFSGDLGRGQAVVDYLGGSVKDIYQQALDALKWKTGLAQQEYSNWFDQWSLERQLAEQAKARAASNAQSNWLQQMLSQLYAGQSSGSGSGGGGGTGGDRGPNQRGKSIGVVPTGSGIGKIGSMVPTSLLSGLSSAAKSLLSNYGF